MGPETMLIMTVVSKAVGFMQSMAAGKAEQAAANIEARQYELDAQASTVRGKEEALSVQKDAWSVKMGNRAAAGGYDPYSSMSFLAIEEENESESEYAQSTAILNNQLNSERLLSNASSATARGKSAKQSAMFGGLGSLFKGGFQAIQLSGGLTSGSTVGTGGGFNSGSSGFGSGAF